MLELGARIQYSTRMAIVRARQGTLPEHRQYWLHIALCILLACIGVSWFVYQLTLVAQPAQFPPDWHGARWIQAANETSPVAYFRCTTNITSLPDAAFVTIAANQTFRLYVNGTLISTNLQDIRNGNGVKAYMFDISSAIQSGTNVFAIRVSNGDQKLPALRASFGIVLGNSTKFYNTGDPDWQATANTTDVFPRYDPSFIDWTRPIFDASSWSMAKNAESPVSAIWLSVNPKIYEHPLSQIWMNAGSGQEAYFVRSFAVPVAENGSWLRIVATGPADILIDGKHVITWNGAPTVPSLQNIDFTDLEGADLVQYRSGLVLGVYDITSYVHPGKNTLAVHVSSPGISSAQVGLEMLGPALNADVLTSGSRDQVSWVAPDRFWRASPFATPGWQEDSNTASWYIPYFVGRPGASRTMYLSDTPTPRNVSIPSFMQIGLVLFLSIASVLVLWLIVSRYMRRYYRSFYESLAVTSLAYLPAVALEALMVVVGREPLVAQPFPYTIFWAMILLLVLAAGYALLWLHARSSFRETRAENALSRRSWYRSSGALDARSARLFDTVVVWLKVNWALVLIVLIAIPLISYEPTYQPYWQDELTSYFAARGILLHGVPALASGFLYTKAELYSYFLAFWMFIFGEQNGAPRVLTMLEYLASLPIFYYMALSFFKRQNLALLATALLAFSPSDLFWGYEMRMYEQAQLFAIITCFLLYRALRKPDSPVRIYLVVGSLVLNYFSHEEIFIIFPAIVIAVLWLSWDAKKRLPEVLYKKHWWVAATVGTLIIGAQLWLSKATHPPILGTDISQQPMIEISVQNLPFYLKLLFYPYPLPSLEPNYIIDSVLSIGAGIWAIRNRDKPAILLFLLFWVGILLLTFMFTLQSDRYVYPILPFLFLLTAYALQKVFSGMWDLARRFSTPLRNLVRGQTNQAVAIAGGGYTDHSTATLSWPIRAVLTSTIVLALATVFFLPMVPLSRYNHLISNLAGWTYHKNYPDYDVAGQYVESHWQKGDIVISVSPAISVLYYVGRVDYFFSIDKALYLFDPGDGRIIDTPTASTPLLSEQDFQAVLSSHTRVWIISDNSSYQNLLKTSGRFNFPTDVRLVFEGYGSAVYLRGS